MKDSIDTFYPELLSTYISEEDQRLLDLWDQGLDTDVTPCLSQDTDSGYESDQKCDSCYDILGEISDDSDDDNDDDGGDKFDDDNEDDEDENEENDDDESSESDSDSDTDNDSDSSSDNKNSDSEDETELKLPRIQPIERKKRVLQPMRVLLLKHLTLRHAQATEDWCCDNGCVAFWPWVASHHIYWDYD